MTHFSATVGGREYTLETDQDLRSIEWLSSADLKHTCLNSEEERGQIRNLLNLYKEAGSPPLKIIDQSRQRLDDAIGLDVFLFGRPVTNT